MKHITRRNFLKTAGVSLASVSLAACGADKTTSASTASSIVPEMDDSVVAMVGNVYVEGLPIVKEPTTYHIMNGRSATDRSGDQNSKEIVKLSTADTNVSLEWTETSDTTFKDTYKMMIATGDGLPDAFFSSTPSETDIAQNPEDFFSMDEETFKTYAPNIYAGMEEYVDGGVDALKKNDGKIYSCPTGIWSEYGNWPTSIPFIRKEWLDKLGLDMPTTIDELYDVLVAFKNNDLNEDGSPVIPMIFCFNNWAAKIQYIAGSWGIAGRNMNNESWFGRVENGEYKLNINEQCFRDFLTEMNKWHKAGLLNIDGFSVSNAEYKTLLNSKCYGLFGSWTPPVEDWVAGKWAALPVLTAKGYEGQELKPGESGMRSAGINTFLITAACKDPLGLLRWWDNCHSSREWKLIGRDGPEGGAWEYAPDGKTAYVKAVDPLPAGCANDTEYNATYAWRSMSPILFKGESAIPNPDKISEDAIRYELCEMYEPYFAKEHIPVTPVPTEVATEFAFTKEEIETAVENYMASAIMSGVTDENWDAFVKELDALGIDQWVTFYQNYIDGNWA